MFKLLISSWLSFGHSHDFRYSSISFRFSNLIKYRFLKYSHIVFWVFLLSVVIFPFSSLILLIWSCSLFLLVNWAKGLSILFIFFKEPALENSFIPCIVFFVSNSLISNLCCAFCYFFLSAGFGFHLLLLFMCLDLQCCHFFVLFLIF